MYFIVSDVWKVATEKLLQANDLDQSGREIVIMIKKKQAQRNQEWKKMPQLILPRPLYTEMDTCFGSLSQSQDNYTALVLGGEGAVRTGIHEPAMNKGEVIGAFHLCQNFIMTSRLERSVVFQLGKRDGCGQSLWSALLTHDVSRRARCAAWKSGWARKNV